MITSKKKILLSVIISALCLVYSCNPPLIIKNVGQITNGQMSFGKNPARTFYEDISISDSLKPKWIAETQGSYSNTSILVFNSTLVIGDQSGRLYAFNSETGKLIGYEKFNGSIENAAAVSYLRLFFVLNNMHERYSTLILYDFSQGKVMSEQKIQGAVVSELLKVDDGVIVLSTTGELVKYNSVGQTIWSVKTKSYTKCSPALFNDVIVFGNSKGELIWVSAKNGEIQSRNKIAGSFESGISVDDSICVIGDTDGNVYAINQLDRTVKWKSETGGKILSTPVFNSREVFVGNLNGYIYCMDKNEGSVKWSVKTNGLINTTPFLFKNILVQPDANKKVHLVKVTDGTILKSINFERRVKLSPVYYKNTLYLGRDKGIIHAYEVLHN